MSRFVTERLTSIAMLGLLVAACTSSSAIPTPASFTAPTAAAMQTTVASGTTSAASPIDGIINAAKAEGTLTTVGLPHDFCNYGGVIAAFRARYGLAVVELAPEAGSADALEALRASKGGSVAEAPDVIDTWLPFGPVARAEELIAPYKVSSWDEIPLGVKDPDGFWSSAYYGVLAFEVNADVIQDIPDDWNDLLGSKYRAQVALAGDPRVSNQAVFSVAAAALARGGTLDNPKPGLEFFAQLNDVGNLSSVIADSDTVVSGETPITIRWTYNALANQTSSADSANITVTVPASGSYAGPYVQAISASAPHPNAARLWMEFLLSDEGQNGFLTGYCNPIRYEDMRSKGAIPSELAGWIPDSAGAVFPSVEQINGAFELISRSWDLDVGLDVGGGP